MPGLKGLLGAVKREMLSLLEFVFVLVELAAVPFVAGTAEGMVIENEGRAMERSFSGKRRQCQQGFDVRSRSKDS